MKKIASLIIAITLLLVPILSYAAPSNLTQAIKCYGPTSSICALTLTWTGASSGGAFAATAITSTYVTTLADYYPYILDTDNGTIAPTASYDITLKTSRGYDILGGAGLNRAASSNGPESVYVKVNSSSGFHPIAGETLTLGITGNSVNSATGVIKLWFVK